MSWQPIETHPLKGGPFLLYYPATKPARGHPANTLGEMVRVGTKSETPFRQPTHWMPLPAPPESA